MVKYMWFFFQRERVRCTFLARRCFSHATRESVFFSCAQQEKNEKKCASVLVNPQNSLRSLRGTHTHRRTAPLVSNFCKQKLPAKTAKVYRVQAGTETRAEKDMLLTLSARDACKYKKSVQIESPVGTLRPLNRYAFAVTD